MPIDIDAVSAALTPTREGLDAAGTRLYERLRNWRLETARSHNLPAYVIFHDGTLREIAKRRPGSVDELLDVPGVGAKKLEAYGQAIVALCDAEPA